MFLDDIPVWVFVGEHEHEDILLGHTEASRHYLYTHLHFSISYNGDHVIGVNVYVWGADSGTHRVDVAAACRLADSRVSL